MRALDVNIRIAGKADAVAISRLISALADKYIVGEFSAEGRETLLRSMRPEAIAGYLDRGFRYHVAEAADGEIVGVVALRDDTHLYHLFVAEACQRRGIGRSLWKTALAEALARGNRGEFTVNSSRYALPVYERLGFVAGTEEIDANGVVAIPMKLVVRPGRAAAESESDPAE